MFKVGDLITSSMPKLKGVVWRIEETKPSDDLFDCDRFYIVPVFGTFGVLNKKAPRWIYLNVTDAKLLNIITLSKEYADFSGFVKDAAKSLGVEFNDQSDHDRKHSESG